MNALVQRAVMLARHKKAALDLDQFPHGLHVLAPYLA